MVLIFRKRHFATRLCSSHPEVYHRASSVVSLLSSGFFFLPSLASQVPYASHSNSRTDRLHSVVSPPLSRPPGDSPRQALALAFNILNEAPGTLLFLVLGRFVLPLCPSVPS